eukprot:scaffold307_cov390-Prasinococcus_capsulatus_cf.AAC.11
MLSRELRRQQGVRTTQSREQGGLFWRSLASHGGRLCASVPRAEEEFLGSVSKCMPPRAALHCAQPPFLRLLLYSAPLFPEVSSRGDASTTPAREALLAGPWPRVPPPARPPRGSPRSLPAPRAAHELASPASCAAPRRRDEGAIVHPEEAGGAPTAAAAAEDDFMRPKADADRQSGPAAHLALTVDRGGHLLGVRGPWIGKSSRWDPNAARSVPRYRPSGRPSGRRPGAPGRRQRESRSSLDKNGSDTFVSFGRRTLQPGAGPAWHHAKAHTDSPQPLSRVSDRRRDNSVKTRTLSRPPEGGRLGPAGAGEKPRRPMPSDSRVGATAPRGIHKLREDSTLPTAPPRPGGPCSQRPASGRGLRRGVRRGVTTPRRAAPQQPPPGCGGGGATESPRGTERPEMRSVRSLAGDGAAPARTEAMCAGGSTAEDCSSDP